MLEHKESEILSAYLDGETDSEELNRVNLMLSTSAEWRQELERLTDTKRSLSTSPRLSAPPDLVASLMNHPALRERKAPRFGFFTARPLVWGGSGLAAAAGFWLVVAAPWATKPLPIAPLLAAHDSRPASPDVHSTLIAASNYSSQIAAQQADAARR